MRSMLQEYRRTKVYSTSLHLSILSVLSGRRMILYWYAIMPARTIPYAISKLNDMARAEELHRALDQS
eukprot:scaffold1311_cov99-Cylindrotheca_fusiformis.AAC.5